MSIKRFFKNWILPPNIISLILKFLSIIKITKKDIEILKKNRRLKDIHKSNRCFILGNGPSINDFDILKIKNELIFVMSNFYHWDKYTSLSPIYHSIVNIPDTFSENEKFLILKELDDKTLSNKIFIGFRNRYVIDKYKLFQNKDIYYIGTANVERKFAIDRITREHYSNPLQAIEIALYMGFSEIYLLGIEYNEVCSGSYFYFFDRKNLIVNDPEIDMCSKPMTKLSVTLQSTLDIVVEFEKLTEFAQQNNVKIFNLSNQSILRMFPHKNYYDLFFS